MTKKTRASIVFIVHLTLPVNYTFKQCYNFTYVLRMLELHTQVSLCTKLMISCATNYSYSYFSRSFWYNINCNQEGLEKSRDDSAARSRDNYMNDPEKSRARSRESCMMHTNIKPYLVNISKLAR